MSEPYVDIISIATVLREQAICDSSVMTLPAPMREALAFAHILDNIPLGLIEGEALAGDCGWEFATVAQREKIRTLLANRPFSAPTPPSPIQLLDQNFNCCAGYTSAHTLLDYERVINCGLSGILEEILAEQSHADGSRLEYLQAMQTSLEAVVRLAERYAQLAYETAKRQSNISTRDQLKTLAHICRRVPFYPATSFHEALQAIWFMHLTIGLSEVCTASLSLGRIDQYLYPFFCADLQAGVSRNELQNLLSDLWRKLNRFGDPACAVNLGGLSEAGEDLFNPLSEMIIKVTRNLKLPSPILATRIHEQIPEAIFESLLNPALLAMGQPTFYGELPCREALKRRGVPEADLHRFALNSCMGLVMPGEEISDMWGAVANLLLPLELAVNAGEPFKNELPIELKTPLCTNYANFDELYTQFTCYLDELIEILISVNREATEYVARERPNPFFSALTRDCITRGLDRADGGARYHSVIVEGFGWVNTADALVAIRRLVFEEKTCSLDDLVQAARDDFKGQETLRQDLLQMPKYGNADAEADEMAAKLTATFAQLVSQHSQGNTYFLPSYHTLNAHIWAGAKLGASLDGRHAKEPLGKNVGPMLGRAKAGLTAILLSASSLPQVELSGGQALDISLQPKLLSTSEGRHGFMSLLQTYFQRGGLQVQVNGLTPADLQAAIAQPQKHQDLIVRIAGYSAQFISLPLVTQEEMCERFEQGL